MKIYEVETIISQEERGDFKQFKSYSAAKKYAIKESLRKGVLETYLSGEDDGTSDDDFDFELQEFYGNGKLKIKLI